MALHWLNIIQLGEGFLSALVTWLSLSLQRSPIGLSFSSLLITKLFIIEKPWFLEVALRSRVVQTAPWRRFVSMLMRILWVLGILPSAIDPKIMEDPPCLEARPIGAEICWSCTYVSSVWLDGQSKSSSWTRPIPIDQFYKSQNAPVPYPTTLHLEQKCAHFCSEWSIMGYGTGAFLDLWIPYPTMLHSEQKCAHICSEWSIVGYGTGAFWDLWISSFMQTKWQQIELNSGKSWSWQAH